MYKRQVHRNRTFDQDTPLHGILERCTQQPMNLMDGCARKKPLLLLFGQFLLLSLDIRTAGCFTQGRVEVLHVVGLEFLHLHAADIGDNQVLDGGKVGFVGFGCPLVLLSLIHILLVIVDQHATVNTFPGLVHTARHTMRAGGTRSR